MNTKDAIRGSFPFARSSRFSLVSRNAYDSHMSSEYEAVSSHVRDLVYATPTNREIWFKRVIRVVRKQLGGRAPAVTSRVSEAIATGAGRPMHTKCTPVSISPLHPVHASYKVPLQRVVFYWILTYFQFSCRCSRRIFFGCAWKTLLKFWQIFCFIYVDYSEIF